MNKRFLAVAVSLSACLFCGSAKATGFFEQIVDTLPSGIISDSSEGFFSDLWNGSKKLIDEGNTGQLLPLYTIHPAWEYGKDEDENGYTWGGGISRSLIDSKGNRRIIYAMAFADSHSNIEPFMGYAWLARWQLFNSPIHLETGYTLGLTFRADYKWLPIPAPLPLLGIGTEDVSFYGTWVPGSNIFYFFTNIVFDDKQHRMTPLPENSAFKKHFLVYAGGGWQKTHMRGIGGIGIRSHTGYTGGIRYFIDRNWAVDISATQARHKLHGRQIKGSYKLTNYSLAIQYHFDPTDNVRLYAGTGAAYYYCNDQKFADGWRARKGSFTPIIQVGATYAFSENLQLTGGLDLGFPRFKGHTPEGDSFSMRPSPTFFKLALGVSF